MTRMIVSFLLLQAALITALFAAPFTFQQGKPPTVVVEAAEEPVVQTALELFSSDYAKVFGERPLTGPRGNLYVGTIGTGSEAESRTSPSDLQRLTALWEGFLITVQGDNLIVLGSDKRGTAYGILELSRLIGVSPWEWWADATPDPQTRVELPEGFRTMQSPSVKHRGIFINDEDWGLTPWSWKNYEPSEMEGQIGPRTHARIFELLLRLRANTFWPAMHECSVPFYLTPGNKEMADQYAIFIGTSHCEPMVRNTNGEWKEHGTGSYDYVNNKANVLRFWEERVTELAHSDNIYTLGIRGVHDSKMLGANTIEEQRDAIINILRDQREMIARHVNPDVKQVSQVFIPYKEVLDVYNAGLDVPDDVTLMWCDDNYGYIRHLPDSAERVRPGGNGIYYHVSYWGRPHDYLWLSTAHPALVYTQMKRAYDYNARQMWILNVGDIKPAEYTLELFLDMAWDIASIENSREGLQKHLTAWLAREFGAENAPELCRIMNEYYRLAYIRKPEFMGGTRTEEADPRWKEIADLPWSYAEIEQRLNDYGALEPLVQDLSQTIPRHKLDAWFQLVEYPVLGSVYMNRKQLYGQLARHGYADWSASDSAYERIVALTEHYNSLRGGKWRCMMDHRPRRLAVYGPVPHTSANQPLPESEPALYTFNGNEYDRYTGSAPLCHGLGYAGRAVSLPAESSLTYAFGSDSPATIRITVALAPNHPVESGTIRYRISVDGQPPLEVDYRTEGRSEEWKLNVLRNQALRTTEHTLSTAGPHTLTITALDEGVIIDQIQIHP